MSTRQPWTGLGLTPWVNNAIASLGFETMTPVQASAIPLFMQHKDVVVEAVTGSGKTLAFLIPVLERLIRREEQVPQGHIGALIICPTRELAMQIYAVYNTLVDFIPELIKEEVTDILEKSEEEQDDSEEEPEIITQAQVLGLSAQLLIGGASSVQQDIMAFRRQNPSVLIGTPGRVNDFLRAAPSIKTTEFELLIMDEADRLLDMGFHDALQSIIERLPKQRRTGLFSATMTDAVSQLVRTGLRNPVKIVVQVKAKAGHEKRTPNSLQIGYMVIQPDEKILQLIRLLHYSLDTDSHTKSIVYFPTCAAVDYFTPLLSKVKSMDRFKIIALHGKQAPSTRQKHFKNFVSLGSGTPSVLFTTDLAARGLDVPDVDVVIQIDPPQDPSAFAHRCGRAGRAGRPGKAIVFLNSGREEEYVPFLAVRKTPVIKLARLGAEDELEDHSNLEIQRLCDNLRSIVKRDRDLYERGMKAFVSYVRFYTKHQATYIFRLQDLDLAGVARCYGLLRLPSMPELKTQKIDFEELEIDLDTFAYKDKVRETARLEALKKPVEIKVRRVEKPVVAWSNKVDARDRKDLRREKKKRKREAVQAQQPAPTTRDSSSEDEEDWKELRRERKANNIARRTKQIESDSRGEDGFSDL